MAELAVGVLVGLHMAVEERHLAVEAHLLFPQDRQRRRPIELLALQVGLAVHSHHADADHLGDVLYLIDLDVRPAQRPWGGPASPGA